MYVHLYKSICQMHNLHVIWSQCLLDFCIIVTFTLFLHLKSPNSQKLGQRGNLCYITFNMIYISNITETFLNKLISKKLNDLFS